MRFGMRIAKSRKWLSACATMGVMIAGAAQAQEHSRLKPISVGVPSGFGASSGMIFGSVAYTTLDPNTGIDGDDDGSIGLGFGLGSPSESVGVEVVLGITSVSTGFWGDGRFADEGNLNFKFHRYVTGLPGADYASLAVGLDNVAGWGTTQDYPVNAYVAYSQVSTVSLGDWNLPMDVTVGYGSAVDDLGRSPGGFASVGFGLTPSLSAGVGWYGDEAHLGAVYFPQQFEFASLGVSYAWEPDKSFDSGRVIVALSFLFQPWSTQ